MSSMRGWILLPSGSPFQTFDVSPGQQIARFSPIARWLRANCRFNPSPNASRSRIVTVPQAIDAMVNAARFFWSRAAPTKRCRTTLRSLRLTATSRPSARAVASRPAPRELNTGAKTEISQLHRHDRVEPRRFLCREIAGKQAGGTEHDRREGRDGERNFRVSDELGRAELRDGKADRKREHEADRAAHRGDQDRLEQELAENPALPCAERHLDADLLHALLDDDIHDVGHTDAADDEREAADDSEEEPEGKKENVQEIELF